MPQLRSILLVLLLAPAALAQIEKRFDPPSPQAGQPFTFTISGFWRDSDVPRVADVFIPGPNRIVITYRMSGGGVSAVTPFSETATIPGLAAGTYRITLRLGDSPVVPLGEAEVTVTGEAPKFGHAFPPIGGTAGSALVQFDVPCPPNDCSNAQVFFGTLPAQQVSVQGSRILAVTPLHTRAGPVDVRIRTASGDWIRHSAFTYVSAFDYETVLLPSLTDRELSGAFGSRWVADHSVYNGNAVDLEPYVDFMHVEWDCPILCVSAPVIPAGRVTPIPTMANFTREPNWLIHVRKPMANHLRWSLRVRDVSRQSQTWGTQLPVVRESDYDWIVQLFDVPLQDRFRQTLRIFAQPVGLTCCNDVAVRFYSIADNKLLYETTAPMRHAPYGVGIITSPSAGSPEFPIQPETATIDHLGQIAELKGHDRVRIEVDGAYNRHLWAYVSVTNNETQHVTVVSPQ